MKKSKGKWTKTTPTHTSSFTLFSNISHSLSRWCSNTFLSISHLHSPIKVAERKNRRAEEWRNKWSVVKKSSEDEKEGKRDEGRTDGEVVNEDCIAVVMWIIGFHFAFLPIAFLHLYLSLSFFASPVWCSINGSSWVQGHRLLTRIHLGGFNNPAASGFKATCVLLHRSVCVCVCVLSSLCPWHTHWQTLWINNGSTDVKAVFG